MFWPEATCPDRSVSQCVAAHVRWLQFLARQVLRGLRLEPGGLRWLPTFSLLTWARSGTPIVFYEPYTFFLVASLLKPDAIADLRRDFPKISKPGFLTVDDVELHGRFKQLVEELEGPAVTEAVSSKLGLDLQPYP